MRLLPGQPTRPNCLKAMKAIRAGDQGAGADPVLGMNTSEPKILEFFEYVGISISEGDIVQPG